MALSENLRDIHPIIEPKNAAIIVETAAKSKEFFTALKYCGSAKIFFQFSKVKFLVLLDLRLFIMIFI
jgi:hypothetical protein